MSARQSRMLSACCGLAIVAVVAAILLLNARGAGGGAAGAAQAALTDVGRFKLGAKLGEERAGFSGLPKIQVFANSSDPNWPAVQACLQEAAIEAELIGSFTAVLVDTSDPQEAQVELGARELGYQVILTALNGKFLGGLAAGFACRDLLALLRTIKAETVIRPEKSPIYARLLETAQPIDWLIQNSERAKADRFVDFLKEFEGVDSPAVRAAEASLNR
ncbi:MAG: hypothetical protein HY619_03025 [Thaumarchaeota archaeon]|nr:hypothetical protein [Nitrososphaerota archaeon]